jgi:hypothetical protein
MAVKSPSPDRLDAAVRGLLDAVDRGECRPRVEEIVILEVLCDLAGLPMRARALQQLGEELVAAQLKELV